MNDRELTELQRMGRVKTVGGVTLASLLADLNNLGIGPEDVEVSGTGRGYQIELWVAQEQGGEDG